MQGVGQVASNDPGTTAILDTPLSAAWESIRTGLRRDCGARTFDGWLRPAELGAFDPDSGELELVMARLRRAGANAAAVNRARLLRMPLNSETRLIRTR